MLRRHLRVGTGSEGRAGMCSRVHRATASGVGTGAEAKGAPGRGTPPGGGKDRSGSRVGVFERREGTTRFPRMASKGFQRWHRDSREERGRRDNEKGDRKMQNGGADVWKCTQEIDSLGAAGSEEKREKRRWKA